MKTIKYLLTLFFILGSMAIAVADISPAESPHEKTLFFQITAPEPHKILWRKTYTSNLRKVELQKVVEKTTTKILRETYSGKTLALADTVAESDLSKTFYKLALLDANNNVEKVYDLSKASRIEMIATAYYPGDPLAWRDGTITFLGHRMQRGMVAVDPKVIPLRTRVYVSGFGYGYASDTGSAIKGNRIDLGVNNWEEEQSWMFRPVTVYILERSKTW